MAEIVSVEKSIAINPFKKLFLWFNNNNTFTKAAIITILLLIIVGPTILSAVFFSNASTPQSNLIFFQGSSIEYGIQVDLENNKVPNSDQINQLKPNWIRFVIHNYCNSKLPSNLPISVKRIAIFNNQSCNNKAPIGNISNSNSDNTIWKNYIFNYYIPDLKKFLINNSDNVQAIEIWNEEDLCNKKNNYCPEIPVNAYTTLISQASLTIDNYNKTNHKNINIIMGGLASGNTNYLKNVLMVNSKSLEKINAIGLHPYNLSSEKLISLIKSYQTITKNIPIWVTEIGINTTDDSIGKKTQTDYLNSMFTNLQNLHIPVIIWYAWSDNISPSNNKFWGLYDSNGIIKPSGKAFITFSKPQYNLITINAVISLEYINISGNDNLNVNNNPVHKSKSLTIYLYKANNNPGNDIQGSRADYKINLKNILSFNINSGYYSTTNSGLNTISIPKYNSGLYTVLIKIPGYLRKSIGTFTISSANSTNNTISIGNSNTPINLIAGDINNDNTINIMDYNDILPCFRKSNDCNATTSVLNDKVIPQNIDQSGNFWNQQLNLLQQNFGQVKGD